MDSLSGDVYQKAIKGVMDGFGGHRRVCEVTSDSASSCLVARRIYAEKFDGIVGVNDQAHIADLLMEDVASLPWVKEVLEKVDGFCTYLHKHRTVKKIFKSVLAEYNKIVYKLNATISKDDGEADESRDCSPNGQTEFSARMKLLNSLEDVNDARSITVKTGIMLKRPSNTRFASNEGVLDSFLRSHNALHGLLQSNRFIAHFNSKTAEEKERRDRRFCGPIRDHELVRQSRVVLELFELMRKYLRVFDEDAARIWDVAPLTRCLKTSLAQFPITEWYSREKRDSIMFCFRKRRDKPPDSGIKVPLIETIHVVVLMLDPLHAPGNYTPFIPYLKKHAMVFAQGLEECDKENYVRLVTRSYQDQMTLWAANRQTDEGMSHLRVFDGKPIEWWEGGNGKSQVLTEFALRTLSASPTAMAVDRSFSAQKLVHTSIRNRLGEDKVDKLMFCRANLLLLKSNDNACKQVLKDCMLQVRSIARDLTLLSLNENGEEEADNAEFSASDADVQLDSDLSPSADDGLADDEDYSTSVPGVRQG